MVRTSCYNSGWEEGDSIAILDKGGCHRFTAAGSGKEVEFRGEGYPRAMNRIAVYPYSDSLEYSLDDLRITIPSIQKGGEPPCIAYSERTVFEMKPVASIVEFSLKSPSVASLSLETPGGESICGEASVTVGSKVISPVLSGKGNGPQVTLVPEEGKAVLDTMTFRIACWPGSYQGGLRLTLKYETGMETVFEFPQASKAEAGQTISLGTIGSADDSGPEVKEKEDISIVFIKPGDTSKFYWPFQSPTLSEISQSYGSKASFPNSLVEFKMLDIYGSYVIPISSTTGFARNLGALQGLKFGGAEGDYIQLPALQGLYLTSVTLVSGAEDSTAGAPGIVGPDGQTAVGGGTCPTFKSVGSSYTWKLYGTQRNTSYRIVLREKGDIYLQSLHLHYDNAPLEDPSADFQQVRRDTIPDFSRVGYHYGEKPIPDIPVKKTLQAPSDGRDARQMIQDALDAVSAPGAVLLKAGTYNVSGNILIRRSGVVLRGEGEGTVIYCTAREQLANVIQMGESTSKVLGGCSEIIARYVPAGQMWVPVKDPEMFSVGQTVFLYRPATNEWLDAIRMRQIPQNSDNSVEQWSTGSFSLYWQRKVVGIEGNKLYLENPVVMGIGSPSGENWGKGYVYTGSRERISECGIENLTIDCTYDKTLKNGKDFIDENHAWRGIATYCVENSWIRDVTTRHMGYCCVHVSGGSHLVTVSGCRSLEPVSIVTGSRRYAFNISGAEACLFTRCHCDNDRHQFISGQRVPGPNVFHRCTSTNARSEAGPHQKWATGLLYDNLVTDGALNLHDRSNYGSGHGWTCANTVLYNCTAASIVCQSPWASALNWAVGCIGTHKTSARSYSDSLGPRPEGVWISEGRKVSPESLYESQLEARLSKGEYMDF